MFWLRATGNGAFRGSICFSITILVSVATTPCPAHALLAAAGFVCGERVQDINVNLW
jgi:hypothetical protein